MTHALFKIERTIILLHKRWERFTNTEKNVYVWNRIPLYHQMWKTAADSIQAKFQELAEGCWEIRHGKESTRIYNHMVQLDDQVQAMFSANKALCLSLMKESGLPVPQYTIFKAQDIHKATKFMKSLGGLFVVKPANGTSAGMGVTTHIKSFKECRRAIALASLYCEHIIIERLVPGECYRFLILNGQLMHVSRRRGLRVIGDGQSTIWQLIERENARRRSAHQTVTPKPVTYDRDMMVTLETQGLSRESVPIINEEVLVKSFDRPFERTVETRTVYTEGVTSRISQSLRNNAIKAAQILNSSFTGVDIITLDCTKTLEECGGVINEINTNPGLHHHVNLDNGEKIPIAEDVLRFLLKMPRT